MVFAFYSPLNRPGAIGVASGQGIGFGEKQAITARLAPQSKVKFSVASAL
jgi:hypothetical protein